MVMNKFILFFLLCFYFQSAFPQTNVYHPFPDSAAVWNVIILGDNQCITCYNHSYWISGDTSINGNTYHKINFSHASGIMLPPFYICSYSSSPEGNYYAGALRED